MARTFTLREKIAVRAPIERSFLLSTSVAIVQRELRMHPVRGRTTGFVVAGDTVQWQGWQRDFGSDIESLLRQTISEIFT
jgi:hypothetical protein